jgi:hypothetical protein
MNKRSRKIIGKEENENVERVAREDNGDVCELS